MANNNSGNSTVQNIAQITKLAHKLFKRQPIQVWYAKLNKQSWKIFIINKNNKQILFKSKGKKTPNEAFQNIKEEIEEQINIQTQAKESNS